LILWRREEASSWLICFCSRRRRCAGSSRIFHCRTGLREWMTGGAGDQWDHLCHQERLALARCSARVRSAQERSITDLCAGAALACSTRFGSRVRSPSLKCQSAHTVAELFGNSRSQQLAGGKPSDVLALCWILESAARDRSLNLLGQGAALTRFVRFLARARAAPSASGFDPAAPARSYRVGSGTTRSKPLAEGIQALTALSLPFHAREGRADPARSVSRPTRSSRLGGAAAAGRCR
jgi:hypothetical protein